MANGRPIMTSEMRHCERFCFNGGVCIGCLRDPHGMAQCVGCTCPQHLWTGERCEIRVGYAGLRSTEDILYILTVTFATFTLLMGTMVIFLYLKNRGFRKDPFMIPADQPVHLAIRREPTDFVQSSTYSDEHNENPQPLVIPGNIQMIDSH
ncbi:unnamed protein product [Hymenolepis diminuta]|uniref:EGF-like domain-containing protein n=1 Tax=Hymenolepis diminuta TaxID=6216 RepID=A0A0R3SJA1_HYMDI|nr:unnamed protein product [Hymenolepis diminuta]VUZ53125.1 unnamed protein product [Hymenolepis diminuta]